MKKIGFESTISTFLSVEVDTSFPEFTDSAGFSFSFAGTAKLEIELENCWFLPGCIYFSDCLEECWVEYKLRKETIVVKIYDKIGYLKITLQPPDAEAAYDAIIAAAPKE